MCPLAVRLVLVSLVCVGGCATDAQRTRTEGAAAGAVAGAVVGQVLGRNTGATVAGAVVGAAAGSFIADRTVDKKAEYARREEELRQSAQKATALAQSSRETSARLTREVAALEASVKALQARRLAAEERQNQIVGQEQQLKALQSSVDRQLAQVRGELERQTALYKAAEASQRSASGSGSAAPPQSNGLQLVASGMRELDGETRSLELIKLQLQQIDSRRSY